MNDKEIRDGMMGKSMEDLEKELVKKERMLVKLEGRSDTTYDYVRSYAARKLQSDAMDSGEDQIHLSLESPDDFGVFGISQYALVTIFLPPFESAWDSGTEDIFIQDLIDIIAHEFGHINAREDINRYRVAPKFVRRVARSVEETVIREFSTIERLE